MTAEPEFVTARIERVLPARPERVYEAWLNESALREFMCPAPGRASEVEVDPRVGGTLRVVMSFSDRQREIMCRFVALDRPERVSFTWKPDGDEPESLVTILLAPHGEDETHMTILHSRLMASRVKSYDGGWTSIAELLGDYVCEDAGG